MPDSDRLHWVRRGVRSVARMGRPKRSSSPATRHRVPPDCAALLLAGLLVAYDATPRIGTDRARVKVTDVLEHSLGLAISPATAATILRRDLKLTVIRLGGKQSYVVGLTPAAVKRLWAQIR